MLALGIQEEGGGMDPLTPKELSIWIPTRPVAEKIVVTSLKNSLLPCFRTYFTLGQSVNHLFRCARHPKYGATLRVDAFCGRGAVTPPLRHLPKSYLAEVISYSRLRSELVSGQE